MNLTFRLTTVTLSVRPASPLIERAAFSILIHRPRWINALIRYTKISLR